MIATIGHSSHGQDAFLGLVHAAGVNHIVDVRSSPFSRMHPQFNRPVLSHLLHSSAIRYTFLGSELGARTDDRSCYQNGRVQYDRLAQTPQFQHGMDRLVSIVASGERAALMCAEKEPLECHRAILIARCLVQRGIIVEHILADGSRISHSDAMNRLIGELNSRQLDLFATPEQILDDAYRRQEEKIAFRAGTGDEIDGFRGEL